MTDQNGLRHNLKAKKRGPVLLLVLLNLCLILSSWKNQEAVRDSSLHQQADTTLDYRVKVNYKTGQGKVSPNLMGFNLEYNDEPDNLWNKGNSVVSSKVSLLKPGQLRWPGGTLVTFYHWNRFSGIQGHKDSWDPAYNASRDVPVQKYMDIDEYLATAKKLHTDLLIGINMGSGKRFSRQADGIAEAKALVLKVKKFAAANMPAAKKYFYLDNEPYQKDANYNYKTAEEYGREINAYVPALKTIDPTIKIIANSKNEIKKPVWTPALIKTAGANIDLIDIHYYWRWGALSFDLWKKEPIMMNQQSRPFNEERAALKAIAAANGHPDIDLVAFEWNLGRKIAPGAATPTESEVALMVAEQYTEFIQSGMPMACFWPLQFPGNPSWNRALLDHSQNYSTNKVYDMFKLFNSIPNGTKIASSARAISVGDEKRIRNLAVKSATDEKVVYVYLINKDQTKAVAGVAVSIPGFSFKNAVIQCFDVSDGGHGNLNVHTVNGKANHQGTNHELKFEMPKNSFAKITLTK